LFDLARDPAFHRAKVIGWHGEYFNVFADQATQQGVQIYDSVIQIMTRGREYLFAG